MLKKLIIFPFGGNAREAFHAINRVKEEWDVLGFMDDDPATAGKALLSSKVLGGREVLRQYPDAYILAVPGNPDNYLKRKNVIDSLGVPSSRFASVIDPFAAVSPDAVIGKNVVVMANVFISCNVRVGDHCVILPNTVISHDSTVGDYALIGSNVSISGNVRIGSMCYIGSGVSVREGKTIGSRSLLGIGSTVVSDIGEGVIAAGNPAKIMRKV